MSEFTDKCFVCEQEIKPGKSSLNQVVHLRVCAACSGTSKEKQKEEEYLDSLADGLVCGCI